MLKIVLKNVLFLLTCFCFLSMLFQTQCMHNNGYEFCRRYFISHATMVSILETRNHLLAQLQALNFVNRSAPLESSYNLNGDSWPLLKAVLSTGLYPNLAYPLNGYLANK